MLNRLRKRHSWLAILLMFMLFSSLLVTSPPILAEDKPYNSGSVAAVLSNQAEFTPPDILGEDGPDDSKSVADVIYGQVSIQVDSSPPVWPGDAQLNVSQLTDTSLTLEWSAATDDTGVAGYYVYQNGTKVSTVNNGTSCELASLAAETTYTMSIQAFDATGNESSNGPTTTATTTKAASGAIDLNPVQVTMAGGAADQTAPTWTDGVLGTANITATGLTLNWSGASDDTAVTGYKLYQGTNLLATLENVTTYDVSALNAATSYSFTVQAVDAAGNISTDGPSTTIDTVATSITTCTVTFMSDGATYDSVTATSGTEIIAPTDPTKDNYTFGGWYADETFTTAVAFPLAVTADVTLYAKWTYSFTYTISTTDNTATVTGYSGSKTDVAVPGTITDNGTEYTVTAIGDNAFKNNTAITAVSIPASVTSIGTYVFNGCTSLTTVTLPDNLKNIGNYAFKNCTGLTMITWPKNLESIGTYALDGCTSLTTVTLPDNLKNIGNYAFKNCTGLIMITWPQNLESIGNYALEGCSSLTTATLPDNLKNIGNYAFRNCTGLTTVTLPENLTSVGGSAFRNCPNLSVVYFLGSQPTFGPYVFKNTASDFVLYYHVKNSTSWAGYNTYTAQAFCTLTLDLQDGSTNESNYVVVDSLGHIAASTTPAREGYTFGGWYKEAECKHAFGFSCDTVSDDLTLYAKWLENTATGHTVTFMLDGGQYMKLAVEPGTTINEPTAPSTPGSAFGGWYADEAFTTVVTFPFEVTADTVFYGKTLAAVTFMSDGAVYTTVSTNIGLQIPALTDPAKTNYVFGGWYTDETFTTAVEFPYTVNEDVTIFAKWVVAFCSVTFISDGSTYFSVTNTVGTAINAPAAPIKADYAFAGWYFDEEYTTVVEFPYTPTSDVAFITLYAKFAESTSASTYTVNFISEGTTYYSITKPEGTGIGAPIDPARDYYSYGGWYTDETYTTAVTFPFVLTADVTVYAKWSYNFSYTISATNNTATITGYNGSATEVVIPGTIVDNGIEYTVTTIFKPFGGVFAENSAITSVIMPDSVTRLEDWTFSHCSSLKSVKLPSRLEYIGGGAFSYCTALSSITIPDSVTYIGGSAFDSSGITEITLPDGVTSISCAFIRCNRLRSINIPASVTSIDDYAFYQCSSLSSITIPDGVTCIGLDAFTYCSSLSSIVIPDSVTSIGFGTFQGCTSLSSVTLPSNLNVVEHDMFNGCSSLETITIPDSVTSIGSYAFRQCRSLSLITLPSGLIEISESMFNGCTALESVNIPDGVTNIGNLAFNSCSSLSSERIPAAVTSVGSKAFMGCSNLTGAYFLGSLPTIGSDAFTNTPTEFVLYYHVKNADSWADFSSYAVKLFCCLTLDLQDGSTVGSAYVEVDSQGHIVAPTTPSRAGFAFAGWYKEAECSNVFNFGSEVVNGDITLYARWEVDNAYTVTFISEGETYTTISAVSGLNIEAPTAPTKDYYTFAGWYADEALTEAVSFPYMVTANATLYAKWEVTSLTPLLVSAGTDDFGRVIKLEFDREMNDPSGRESQFSVTAGGNAVSINSLKLGSDSRYIYLYLGDKIGYAAPACTVNISYTKGDVQAAEGSILESFSEQNVYNNVQSWMLVDYEPDATEIGCTGNSLTFELKDTVDYDEVDMSMYLRSGFFETMVDNLNNYVRFYEKDTGEAVVLTNLITEPHGSVTARHMEVTDWYFDQVSGRAPLGLDLVSRALKPSTTYVIEIDQGFTFNHGGTLGGNYIFEFTTTADSSTKPYWESGSELTVSNVSDNSLTLSWPLAADNHGVAYENTYSKQYIPNLSYRIYQDGNLLATVDGKTTSYEVGSLSPNTSYDFKVEVVDFANNNSLTDLQTTAQTTDQVSAVPITSPTVTIDESGSNRKLAVTASTPSFQLTVPASVTNATLDVSPLMSTSGDTTTTSALPAMDIAAATSISSSPVVVSVPVGTTISASASSNWDGTINVPTVKSSSSVTVPASSGYSTTTDTVIEVGFGNVPLNLSQAVRILIPGQAGKEVGYVHNGIFTKITNVLTADTQAAGDALAAGSEGKIDVGNDLVVWTKHFTSFVTYTETANTGGSTDNTPPVWSSGSLSGSNVSSSGLTLTWSGASDDTGVVYYDIYEGTQKICTVGSSMDSYNVTGLSASTAYTFTVQAGDAAGNWSTTGPSTQATTLASSGPGGGGSGGNTDTQAPQFPAGAALSIQMTGNQQAKLTWPLATDNVGVTGYNIFRYLNSNSTGSRVLLGVVDGADNTFSDPNSLPSGTNASDYTWEVQACDAAGNLSTTITGSPATGQNPLNFVPSQSYLVTISGTSANNIALIQGNSSVPVNPTIMLYFDRGITNDTVWSNNKQCITLQDATGVSVPINVFWLENDPGTVYVHDIFLTPTSNLTPGQTYKIIISKNLTANNGKTLGDNNGGKDEIVTFTVAGKSTSAGGGTVTTSGPTYTNGSGSVDPAMGAIVGLGSEAMITIPANALSGTGTVDVSVRKVTTPPAIPAGFKLAGDVYEFSVGGANSCNFGKDVALTFSFNPADFAAGESPTVYYYDESAGNWVSVGGTVSGNTITVIVSHLTKYAIFAVKETVTVPKEPEAASPATLTLSDIMGHWAQISIEKMAALGVVSGYSDNSFKPDNSITRAEFVTILVKAFNIQSQDGKVFADTSGHWAMDYIATAAANGLVNGYDTISFRPDDLITREQMAVMIVKAAKFAETTDETAFTDRADISSWAGSAVATAVKNGIIKGYLDNTFKPQGSATRAEAVTVIVNALNQEKTI